MTRMDIPAQQLTKDSFMLVTWAVTGSFNGMSFVNMVLCWKVLTPNH